MDEPTSSLTPREFDRLAELIGDLKSTGVSLIYVSHKMNEIFRVCDRATIMRDGKQVGVVNINDEDEESIVAKMVGRKIDKLDHQAFVTDREVLRVEDLTRGNEVVAANFSVRAGEVLGIAGLVGAGRTELLKLIAGIDRRTRGTVSVNGAAVKNHNVRAAIKAGIGLVPEDRKKRALSKSGR